MIESHQFFKEHSYVVLENFIPHPLVDFFYEYSLLLSQRLAYKTSTKSGIEHYSDKWDGDFDDTNGQFGSNAINFYGDPLMETLLIKSLYDIEKNTGLELVPTYAFLRLYQNGDSMVKHDDRDSCEISATACLGYVSEKPWSIWLTDKNNNDVEVTQKPGDILIYKGCELPHWRNVFSGQHHSQTFIHYNRKDNNNNNYKDGRPFFAVPKKI